MIQFIIRFIQEFNENRRFCRIRRICN